MKTVAIVNQKGGVGKTTSAINVGAGLSKLGKQVLLIDLDPQAQATYSLGIPAHELEKTVYDLLAGEASPGDVTMPRGDFKVIPSNLGLSGAEANLRAQPGSDFLLREALAGVKGFDYVLIDCPPSLGLLTTNALAVAGEVWVPMQTEFLALQGLSDLLKIVGVIRTRLNPPLEISGIIATRYDRRKILNREVVDKIKEHFGDKLHKTLIRENISIAEAPGYGQTIFEYRPGSYGAEDYLNLSREILERAESWTKHAA